MSTEISLIPSESTPEKIETSIGAFNQPLSDLLRHIGLPTENVLKPIEERRKVIFSLESVLEILPMQDREKAYYLSKFTVAITAGLFDGALNFLWDETVKAVRNLAITYDLQYFYNVAETISSRYKNLSSIEDIEAITDYDLLEICRRIGLINDVNFKRLEHVNYLRNHASAAHPNENEITGHEMLSLLETCLKYAITAKPDHSVIQIKLLFQNIREKQIPDEDIPVICEELIKIPIERLDDFIQSLFGVYCDTRQSAETRENIEKISSQIWVKCSIDTKYRIGSKYGIFRKNGDQDRKDLAQKYLEKVNGLEYKDEDSLAAELIEKLQDLRTVHFEWNNFYNEYSHARSIENSLPKTGIPKAARKMFVKIICLCYIGNGLGYRKGVDERAEIIYVKFLKLFGINELKDFLDLLGDSEFVTDFNKATPDLRLRELVRYFKTLTTDIHLNNVFNLIINFPSKSIHKISTDSRFKDIIKNIK